MKAILDDIMEQLVGVNSLLSREIENSKFKDETKKYSVTDIARLQKQLGDVLEISSSTKTELQKMYDFIRYTRVPEIMENNDIESISIDGVGRVYLLSDVNVSVKAGQKEGVIEWLIMQGLGDIVQETVNGSTLKATIKREMTKGGTVIPENLFNVSPFTRAQIVKK